MRRQVADRHVPEKAVARHRKASLEALPSASGGMSRLVVPALRAAGIAPRPLLEQAGLTLAQIDDPKARVPVQGQIRLLELASRALGDDLLGFHLARSCELRELGLVYYVLASSEVLADALQNAARYGRIVNEGVRLRIREGRETGIGIEYVNVERRDDRQHIDFWLTIIVRLVRELSNRRLAASHVRVIDHRRKVPAEFRSFLGCTIDFAAGVDEVVFPRAIMQTSVVGADTYLNDLLTRYCEEALTQRRGARVVPLRTEVENAIAPLLPHGTATAPEIARRLGLSHRTLARRLADEELSFTQIAHELKLDLAKRYLRDDLPVSRIAWLLGYHEVSAFTHAFKRWTGKSPRQWTQHENVGAKDVRRERSNRGRQAAGSTSTEASDF